MQLTTSFCCICACVLARSFVSSFFQTALCVPEDDGYTVHSSTQWTALTQAAVAEVLGIPASRLGCGVCMILSAYMLGTYYVFLPCGRMHSRVIHLVTLVCVCMYVCMCGQKDYLFEVLLLNLLSV